MRRYTTCAQTSASASLTPLASTAVEDHLHVLLAAEGVRKRVIPLRLLTGDHEQEPPPLARRGLVGGRRPRAHRLHLGKRIDATPRNGRRFSLLGGGQPGEQPLHGADPGQVAAGVVVAAALSRRQPEAAPRVAAPRTGAADMYAGGQIPFLH